MKKLYVMCGVPGSGKSTWLRSHVQDERIVSRDAIRFSLLKPTDEYFAHEAEVEELFYNSIREKLREYDEVYVDATHLTPRSRAKVMRCANRRETQVIALVLSASLTKCLEQNAQRTGRALVPQNTIKQMFYSFIKPTVKEGFSEIIEIGD